MAHAGDSIRAQAIELASRKFRGQHLADVKQFLRWHRRSQESIEKLMARIADLPDLDIDPTDRVRLSVSSGEDMAMQEEREAGWTLREIAARHDVAASTVCRHTKGEA